MEPGKKGLYQALFRFCKMCNFLKWFISTPGLYHRVDFDHAP